VQNPLTPPSILIITGAKGDTRRYRAFHLYQQLLLAGIPEAVCHITDGLSEELVRQCKLIIFHRTPYDPRVSRLIRSVRSRNGLVLVDADDLIFDSSAFQWIDSPDFKDPVRAKLYQAEMQRQQQTLLLSDGALTSTDYLAEVVRKMGKPAWVHRNAANLEMLEISNRAKAQKRRPDGKYVIGYASGTPTHNRDFALIAPALMETLRVNPMAELWVIGHLDMGAGWQPFHDRVRTFKPVPWRELPFWLAQLDVNLAPLLLDNPFSQSKSEIKFMEAALVGVPTIASPTDAFSFAIQDGLNGLLAHTLEDWQAGLLALTDHTARSLMAEHAASSAVVEYAPQNRSRQLVTLLGQISSSFRQDHEWGKKTNFTQTSSSYNWPVEWETQPSLLKMGWYSLQSRGVMTLLKQLWITLRRLLVRWIPYR